MHSSKRAALNSRIKGHTISIMVIFVIALLVLPISPLQAQTKSLVISPPGSFSELVKHVSASVVNINVEKVVKRETPGQTPFGAEDPMRDFFDRFFGGQMPKEFKQRGLGTGFIIDKDGFVLTNNHVIENADEIKVRLADEREFSAKVIGKDPSTDLALIKIDAEGPFVALPLGDSDKLEVGDWVLAIGNPFGLGNTVTAGIVSAKYRQIGAGAYDNFIQTDASINPGNSGGPLLNIAGEAIAINSSMYSQSGGSIGIGFAIPINMAKGLIPQLKTGKVIRGALGVMIQKITPELKNKLELKEEKGALVSDVMMGGAADKAGILRGDVIVSFNGMEIKNSGELPPLVASTQIGKRVPVEVLRKGEKMVVQVEIGELMNEKQDTSVFESKTVFSLGMRVEALTPEIAQSFGLSGTTGVVVVEIEDGGPASENGVQPGDIILAVDQEPVNDLEKFNEKVNGYQPGDTILLLIERQGATLFLTLKLTE